MNAHDKIAVLSEWIDSSYPESMIGTELHTRRRVDKLMEEAGEVGQAVGGWYGENPRKGITHTRADVLGELLDVAVTALGAYESLTGNAGASGPALDTKMDGLLERVGLSLSNGAAKCDDHMPVQHRDAKPPWCPECGLTAEFTEPVSRLSNVVCANCGNPREGHDPGECTWRDQTSSHSRPEGEKP